MAQKQKELKYLSITRTDRLERIMERHITQQRIMIKHLDMLTIN